MKRLIAIGHTLAACLASQAFRSLKAFITFACILCLGLSGRAQSAPAATAPGPLTTIPASTWAVEASKNELSVLHYQNSYLRYRVHIIDAKGDRIRDIIESRDGTVARLIYSNGKPLTQEQDNAERERLNEMLSNPDTFAKHAKGDQSGKKIADSLIKIMPDAMIYTYVPGQPQTGKNPGITEVVIDYEPNPQFHPPSTTAEALTGLKGRAWIDPKSKMVLRMEGNIFRSVNLGWGMLAHIYPGGRLVFEQADTGNGRWIYTHFQQRISVRALMVKSININTDVDANGFQAVPAMSYQDAIHLLLSTPLPAKLPF